MFYKLLGMVVWKGAKLYLRRRYGDKVPSRALAALIAVVAVGGGVAAALAARSNGGESA